MNDQARNQDLAWELLIAQLQAAPPDADLWTAAHGRIAAYVAAMRVEGLSSTDREDVVQCALMGLLEALATLDPAKGPVAAYVKRIIRSAVCDHFRKEKAGAALLKALAENLEDEPAPAAGGSFLSDLEAQMGQLPEEEQRLLRMRFWDGLPLGKIAEAMNKTDGSTRMQLSRLLAKLRGRLLA